MTRPSMKTTLWTLAVVAAMTSLTGCEELEEPTFTNLYDGYFQECKSCHAPGAPGFEEGKTETSLNFSSQSSAYNSISTGKAAGLVGNQADCNGVRFVDGGADPAKSLIVAVLDGGVRRAFDLSSTPNCNQDTISDMTVKVGSSPSSGFVDDLKEWIEAGAPND